MSDKIQLTLTEEQAYIVSVACEFYTRIRVGQFGEITWHTMAGQTVDSDYCERRDNAEKYLFEARKYIYPDLYGRGHSYGIGKFKDADLAFDVHQVLRNQFGAYREPFSYHELPECERIKAGGRE